MRRIIIIGTALAVLVGASAAYAAFNSYTGSKLSFAPKVVKGAIGETEILQASAPAGSRAAPLTHEVFTVYGVKSDGKDFPKCTDAMIANNPKFDAACPKGSLVGQGPVHSLLGPGNDPSTSRGVVCNPFLHIYNGGQGTVVFFFTTDAQHQCGGLRTGAASPYDGHVRQVGQNLVLDEPLPADISTQVAHQPGLYSSLITETLAWKKLTKKVHGKTVAYQSSFACKKGKRPWSIQLTAQNYSGGTETQTVKGTDKC